MYTPYDWQEGMGHRAQFVEAKLAQGTPVVAFSHTDGLVMATYRRQARKVFEIYDRLAFSSIGQQSDIEALRVAAVEFAHKEGYNRSEQDVTIQRLVTALSQPLKSAFGDFNMAPIVARSLFVELGPTIEEDGYFTLDYDGDFQQHKLSAVIAGSTEDAKSLTDGLASILAKPGKLNAILKKLEDLWPKSEEGSSSEELVFEAAILERSTHRETKFKLLTAV
jgi:proteasome alpha subunit